MNGCPQSPTSVSIKLAAISRKIPDENAAVRKAG